MLLNETAFFTIERAESCIDGSVREAVPPAILSSMMVHLMQTATFTVDMHSTRSSRISQIDTKYLEESACTTCPVGTVTVFPSRLKH